MNIKRKCGNCEFIVEDYKLIEDYKVHKYKRHSWYDCFICWRKIYGFDASKKHLYTTIFITLQGLP